MSMQENVNGEPDTISSEAVAASQQPCLFTSTDLQVNIRPIVGALGIMDRLCGVSFDWKLDGRRDIGFISEEVADVLPEAVAYDDNGKNVKVIDCGCLVAVLTEAVKEQQVQIKNHEHSLKEQKAQIARLRAEIKRLKLSTRAATGR